jgi:phosphoribosylaminoimidazole-succinocarboxamide synthase
MSVVQLATGKTKTVTSSNESNRVFLTFRDDVTASDGEKHELLPGKGRINATITAKLYDVLNKHDIPNHLIKQTDDVTLLVQKLEMIPVEVVCRLRAAGHFIGIGKYFQSGDRLPFPLVEFYLKDDALHDPMVTDEHLRLLRLADYTEIEEMKRITLQTATVLERYFDERNAILADFKLEFGRNENGGIIIGDELSPDSWRLWDKSTKEILDKDRFRKNLPRIFELGYEEPYRRVLGEPEIFS